MGQGRVIRFLGGAASSARGATGSLHLLKLHMWASRKADPRARGKLIGHMDNLGAIIWVTGAQIGEPRANGLQDVGGPTPSEMLLYTDN